MKIKLNRACVVNKKVCKKGKVVTVSNEDGLFLIGLKKAEEQHQKTAPGAGE